MLLDLSKTAIISLALGSLLAFGYISLQSDDPGPIVSLPHVESSDTTPPDTTSPLDTPSTADPTLLDELALLKAERDVQDADTANSEVTAPPDEEGKPKEFENYGVAYHFHTQMLNAPKRGAKVVAYARRGATFRVGERIDAPGCSGGWFEVSPGDLFICNGDGANVDASPVSFDPAPQQPRVHAAMPYHYAYSSSDNTIEYWKIPSPEEQAEVMEVLQRIAERDRLETDTGGDTDTLDTPEDTGKAAPAEPPPAPVSPPAHVPSDAQIPPSKAGETTPPAPQQPAEAVAEVTLPDTSGVEEILDTDTYDPYQLPPFVHLRMPVGYYVSLDDSIETELGIYQKTIRGRYILKEHLKPVEASSFEGALVTDKDPLPFVFVVRDGVKLSKQAQPGGKLKKGDRVERYTRLPYLGTVKRGKRRYVQVGEDLFIPRRSVAVAETVALPRGVGINEKWIDINLSEQTLVAYEGETPVFATLVSTGRKEFETPEGSFRIYNKHVSITMDDTEAGAEAYSIEDVPWTQYFKDAYAIHAAFWHDRFGHVRSHGCVNMSPADAQRLFNWTEPQVPNNIHGIAVLSSNEGTRVFVHK